MTALITRITHMLDRSIDYLAIIAYALHNIFFAMGLESDTLRLHTYMLEHWGISAIWLLIPLMLGLLLSACLFLHWKIRVYGTFPLMFVAFVTVGVYVAENAPLRTVFGIAGLYYSLALMPYVLMIVYGRLTDAIRKADALAETNRQQNELILKLQVHMEHEQSEDGTIR